MNRFYFKSNFWLVWLVIAVIAAVLAHVVPARSDDDLGVQVIDGDTLIFGAYRHRIAGIDAPELKQMCTEGDYEYPCGLAAKNSLENILMDVDEIVCQLEKKDKYNRDIGKCEVWSYKDHKKYDLGELMVLTGWAVAYRKYSTDYVKQEEYARQKRNGIWASQFEMPWDYRRGK